MENQLANQLQSKLAQIGFVTTSRRGLSTTWPQRCGIEESHCPGSNPYCSWQWMSWRRSAHFVYGGHVCGGGGMWRYMEVVSSPAQIWPSDILLILHFTTCHCKGPDIGHMAPDSPGKRTRHALGECIRNALFPGKCLCVCKPNIYDILWYINIYDILKGHKTYMYTCIHVYMDAYMHTYIHRSIHPCITLHYITLHCIAFHCLPLRSIAFHCIPLHYIALHYIGLHYITIHTYIQWNTVTYSDIHTSIHPSMHACIHTDTQTYIHACMHAYINTYIHTYMTWHDITLHLHLHYITLHYITIHPSIHPCMHACIHTCIHTFIIPLHYITFTLHYVTLHSIPFHSYIHTYYIHVLLLRFCFHLNLRAQ